MNMLNRCLTWLQYQHKATCAKIFSLLLLRELAPEKGNLEKHTTVLVSKQVDNVNELIFA